MTVFGMPGVFSHLEFLDGHLDGLLGLQQDTVSPVALDDQLQLVHLLLEVFRLGRVLAPFRQTFPRRKQFYKTHRIRIKIPTRSQLIGF